MYKALIITDFTFDFVDDTGELTVGKPAQLIEKRILALAEDFLAEKQFVVLANDIHDPKDTFHPENRLFPPHNVAGSKGRDPYGKLRTLAEEHTRNPYLFPMSKTRYSAFASTTLDLKLRERSIEQVHIVGVCSDICVLHTAIDAYNRGFKLHIHTDAIASFNPSGHRFSLSHFASVLGATLYKENRPLGYDEILQTL